MKVKKGDGRLVPYDPEKVRKSIRRTGASDAIANRVIADLEADLYDGMTTAKLYHLVHAALKRQSVCFSCRYSLRDAIFKMGPTGFNFEYYVAAILRAYGHDAHVPKKEIQGACVSHEVDLIAEKDDRRIFGEAKFRNDKAHFVDLKDTMATWSRFLDLVDGAAAGKAQHFDDVWLVTNARFSNHAIQFGECKGMHLVGWSYPETYSLNTMVDNVKLYPVTVIDDLTDQELQNIAQAGLILCKDIEQLEPEELARRADLSIHRAEELIELCHKVVMGE